MEWNGKTTPHLCLMKKKKEHRLGGKNEKETDFKVPTAHGDRKWGGRGFDRVSLWVLTRLSVGLKTEMCVLVEVACMSVQYTPFHGLTSAFWLTGVVEERPRCSRGGRHPAVCQSAGWKMTAIWFESTQHNSQRGRGWREKCQSLR